jgi:hypothetical protein
MQSGLYGCGPVTTLFLYGLNSMQTVLRDWFAKYPEVQLVT